MSVDTTLVRGSWPVPGTPNQPIHFSHSLNVPPPPDSLEEYYTNLSVHSLYGTHVVHQFQVMFPKVRGKSFPVQFYNDFYVPSSEGWKPLTSMRTERFGLMHYPFSIIQDPEDASIVIGMGLLGFGSTGPMYRAEGISLHAFNLHGDSLWSVDTVPMDMDAFFILPLERNRFMVIGEDHRPVIHFMGSTELHRHTTHGQMNFTRAWMLPGERMVTAYGAANNDDGWVRTEFRDTTGAVMAYREVKTSPRMKDWTFVHRPGSNGIALIFTNDREVVCLSLDGWLNELDRITVTDSAVNGTNPTGLFRNDTLFIAWEDSRTGNPEIFANAVTGVQQEPILGVRHRATSVSRSRLAYAAPNPVRDMVVVRRTDLSGEPLRVTLYNVLGERMRETVLAGGENVTNVNVHDLPGGHYHLRISSGKQTDGESILIAR